MRRALTLTFLIVVAGVGLVAPVAAAPATPSIPLVTKSSIIKTMAGTGIAGFSGDGGLATSSQLNQPRDTALRGDGAIYIVDTFNNRVRKIDSAGKITTVAGTGVGGYSGDGGLASKAALKWPHDILFDGKGNIYLADSNNNRIRKIDSAGVITTVVGTGVQGYNGDGLRGTQTTIKLPKGLAVFGGYLYFSDSLNYLVRRLNLTTNIVETVAGTPQTPGFGGDGGPATKALLNTIQRIALDSVGNVYLADTINNRIRRVSAANGIIGTVVGNGTASFSGDGGPARDAGLREPRGVALVGDSNLYVADSGNARVRLVNLSTGRIDTVVGDGTKTYRGDGGPAGSASLYNPRGLTVAPDGRLLIADTLNSVVRVVTP